MALIENANLLIVLPAVWLHDLVNLPKNHPERNRASLMSADEALIFLKSIGYPETYFKEIHHAICAHSFSANIIPKSIEAKIVQDADRLDGLGAVGIFRLFTVSAQLKKGLQDSLAHIEEKLRIVANSMQTQAGTNEAKIRMQFIDYYIEQLNRESHFGQKELYEKMDFNFTHFQ
jgi:uncharacterized protein